jgi:high-affinity nickel-transport protein
LHAERRSLAIQPPSNATLTAEQLAGTAFSAGSGLSRTHLSLPLLFAAGMSLMDTVDGAFMSQAYGWAFSNPVRKVYYNITVTSLSVAVALLIGTIELLQVAAGKLGLESGLWAYLNGLDFSTVGYGVAGLFVLAWALSVVLWKTRRIEERWGELIE